MEKSPKRFVVFWYSNKTKEALAGTRLCSCSFALDAYKWLFHFQLRNFGLIKLSLNKHTPLHHLERKCIDWIKKNLFVKKLFLSAPLPFPTTPVTPMEKKHTHTHTHTKKKHTKRQCQLFLSPCFRRSASCYIHILIISKQAVMQFVLSKA